MGWTVSTVRTQLTFLAKPCLTPAGCNSGFAAARARCSAGAVGSAAGASRHPHRKCIRAGRAAVAPRGRNRQAFFPKGRRVYPLAHTLYLPEDDSNPGVRRRRAACGRIRAGDSAGPGCGWKAIRKSCRKTSLDAPASFSQVGGSRRHSAHPRVSTYFKPACEVRLEVPGQGAGGRGRLLHLSGKT